MINSRSTYHYAEAQTERTRQENVTVLYAKVAFAWKQAHDDVDAYYSRTEDTGFLVPPMLVCLISRSAKLQHNMEI